MKSGITGVPAEVIESVAPIRMHKRELLTDTGGEGKFRGGLGQEMILEVLMGKLAIHSCMYDCTKFHAIITVDSLGFDESDIREGLGSCSRYRERFYLFNSSSIVLSKSSSAPFAMPASITDGSSLHSASAASRLRW